MSSHSYLYNEEEFSYFDLYFPDDIYDNINQNNYNDNIKNEDKSTNSFLLKKRKRSKSNINQDEKEEFVDESNQSFINNEEINLKKKIYNLSIKNINLMKQILKFVKELN